MRYPDYPSIPDRMQESIWLYANEHEPVGGFLTAVFAHDLFLAVGRADAVNIDLLREYVRLIQWELPGTCHGSLCAVNDWLNKGLS